jgi:hypothetical protein
VKGWIEAMRIILRSHTNTDEEIASGQKVGFTSIRGIDAISVTANLNGTTPMSAVLKYLNVDKKTIRKIADYSNTNGHVELFKYWPNLILLPPTRAEIGRHKDVEFYTIKMLKICNAENFKELHFTHYGFMNGIFQKLEIRRILAIMLNPLIYTTLETIYWEIDSRYIDEMKDLYREVNVNCNGYGASYPEVILSVENKIISRQKWMTDNYWRDIYARHSD